MIKYGIGGKELNKPDNKELVLTSRGFVHRQKEEKERSNAANEVAKRFSRNKGAEPDKVILAQYVDQAVRNFIMSENERNFSKINKANGGNEK